MFRLIDSQDKDVRRAAFSVDDFGAVGDNVTDDYVAIQSAIDAAAAANGGEVVFSPDKIYLCNQGLSLDTYLVAIRGHGATIDFANLTSGNAITLFASNQNSNNQSIETIKRGFRNLSIVGPTNGTGVTGCYLSDPISSLANMFFGWHDGGIFGFDVGLHIGDGISFVDFRRVSFGSTKDNNLQGVNVKFDSGIFCEAARFTACQFRSWGDYSFDDPSGADLQFIACQFDYNQQKAISKRAGGHARLIGCYFEFNSDNDYVIEAIDNDAHVSLVGCRFAVTGNRSSYPFFYSASGVYGGIDVTQTSFSLINDYDLAHICDGDGRFVSEQNTFAQTGKQPNGNLNNSLLAFPSADDALVMGQFTVSNSTAFDPFRVTGVSGRDAVRFQVNAGVGAGSYSRAVVTVNYQPGKRARFNALQYGDINLSNTEFRVTMACFDSSGAEIYTTGAMTIDNVGSNAWSLIRVALPSFTPPGTEKLEVTFELYATGTTVGNSQYNVTEFSLE